MSKDYYSSKMTLLQRVQSLALGREAEIIHHVGGIAEDLLDGKHHPCPKCGGTDRFRHMMEHQAGVVICNQCFNENNGDFIAAVKWMRDCTFSEAIHLIADYLGIRIFSIDRNQEALGRRFRAIAPPKPPKIKELKPKSQNSNRRLVRTIPYEYPNGVGDYHVLIERLEFDDGSKSFRQSHWDFSQNEYMSGTKGVIAVPFNAPEFKEASIIYWTEGEKAATTLGWVMESRKPEVCCSCNWGGSKNFPPELVPWFNGKEVVIFADNDQPGRKYARKATSAITGTAKSVKVVSFLEFREKYDIADWITEESEMTA